MSAIWMHTRAIKLTELPGVNRLAIGDRCTWTRSRSE